jgi:2-aminoadipate transaminase
MQIKPVQPRQAGLSELALRTEEPPITWLMSAVLDRPKLISLAVGFTDSATLPVEEAADLLKRLLKNKSRSRAALQYGSTRGLPELRQLTADRVSSLDQLSQPIPSDNVVITTGSQQLLYLLTEALCDPGDIVLVEDPTYFVYLGILQSRGVHARAVRMRPDGIDLEHLEQVLRELRDAGELPRLKLFYMVSYFQNPTGRSTGFQKKLAALDLLRSVERAAGHAIYLLEDAAYRELGFAKTSDRSALAAKRNERVFYTGTYSKPFATGVRVGFGILPEPVLGAVLRIKGNHDFGSSSLLSWLLAEAIHEGVYERHLACLRVRYQRKARLMERAMKEHFPAGKAMWEPPQGGLYFWVQLPKTVRTGARSKLFKSAVANDVLYVPGEFCYAEDRARSKPKHELRISFGAASESDIRLGVARLGKALEKG